LTVLNPHYKKFSALLADSISSAMRMHQRINLSTHELTWSSEIKCKTITCINFYNCISVYETRNSRNSI